MKTLKLSLFVLLLGYLVVDIFLTAYFYALFYMLFNQFPPLVPWIVWEATSWPLAGAGMILLWRHMDK